MIEAPSSSAEIINSALTKHRLQKFTISNNRLKILELLGAGEEHSQSLPMYIVLVATYIRLLHKS